MFINKFKEIKDERWLRRYLKFIESFKKEKSIKNKTHNHHILPRSLFPEYKNLKINKWNKAILTYREHYIAHYLLAKALGGNMWYAFNRMNNGKNKNKFNSRLFAVFKKEHSIAVSKYMTFKNPMFNSETREKVKISNTGKKASQETKAKMSKNSYMKTDEGRLQKSLMMKENNPNQREDVRIKISKAKLGQKHSQETKDKMSKSKTGLMVGLKHPKVQTILIYDINGILKFVCNQSFSKFCKEHKLPYSGLKACYEANKLYTTRNNKYKGYIGWKIIKVQKEWFVSLALNSSELSLKT